MEFNVSDVAASADYVVYLGIAELRNNKGNTLCLKQGRYWPHVTLNYGTS